MKNRKSFLKGALCGALAMLLVAGLVSCGLKVNNGNSDITSKTEVLDRFCQEWQLYLLRERLQHRALRPLGRQRRALRPGLLRNSVNHKSRRLCAAA